MARPKEGKRGDLLLIIGILGGLVALTGRVSGQYQDFLSPNMEFETMALANASFILSQAQQNLALQSLPLQLEQRNAKNVAPPASAQPHAVASATHSPYYRATDFQPKRSRSISEQFAALSADPRHREALQKFGQTLFDELEKNPEFRSNNLTYAVGLAIGSALGIERERELTDEESYQILDSVHEFLTTGSDVLRRSPEEQTALYDTCVLFTGLMAAFDSDAKTNGHPETRQAAHAVARAVLKVFGLGDGRGLK